MFIKICGITNEDDALLAVALGADALGFVFAPSRRQVKPDVVRDIVKRLPREESCAGSAMRRTSKHVASRHRTSPARSARAPGCTRPARFACIQPEA